MRTEALTTAARARVRDSRGRPTWTLALAVAGALALPSVAQAASVSAQSASVRSAPGSWTIGNLVRADGFSPRATSGAWSFGMAGGEARRCGWVLNSALDTTNPSPGGNACGDPRDVGIPQEGNAPASDQPVLWVVKCQSATLFRNFDGANHLGSTGIVVTQGQQISWYYTYRGFGSAAVGAPDGNVYFTPRECVEKAAAPPPPPPPPPPPGPVNPGPPGPGPVNPGPPDDEEISYEDLADEETDYEFLDLPSEEASAARATASKRYPVESNQLRFTLREGPQGVTIGNLLPGDEVSVSASCAGWLRVTAFGAHFGPGGSRQGWIKESAVKSPPRAPRRCIPLTRSRYIGTMNAPFRSYKRTPGTKRWRHVQFPSDTTWQGKANPAACPLFLNYSDTTGLDQITYDAANNGNWATGVVPMPGRSLFGRNPATRTKVGFRYRTPNGAFDLISIKSGKKKETKSGLKPYGIWVFTPVGCVKPVAYRDVRICPSVSAEYRTSVAGCYKAKRKTVNTVRMGKTVDTFRGWSPEGRAK